MKRRGVLILKRENVKKIVGITSPDNRKMKSVEEEGYKNLGIVEYDDLFQGHKKNVLKKEYFRRLKTVQCPMSNVSGKILYLQQIHRLCHLSGMELEK